MSKGSDRRLGSTRHVGTVQELSSIGQQTQIVVLAALSRTLKRSRRDPSGIGISLRTRPTGASVLIVNTCTHLNPKRETPGHPPTLIRTVGWRYIKNALQDEPDV